MAQHDMNIANQGFPATRADLNNALQAIATNNSGTSAPSTTFANQWWYDTNNNKLYIRNEANNAWIEVAVLDQTNNEWQITTGVIKAKDGDGIVLKTDDGTTRLTLDDSGNFLVGTTGKIGLNSDRLHIGSTEGTDAFIGFGNQIIRPTDSAGATRDAAIDIGYDNMRFRDLYLSGGIKFDASASVGTGLSLFLDDFEEGYFEFTQNQGGVGFNSSFKNVQYTKIGRLATVSGLLLINSSGDTNILKLNMPFTAKSGTPQQADAYVGTVGSYQAPTGDGGLFCHINQGTAHLAFIKAINNAPWQFITGNELGSGDHLYFNITYATSG
jgi:hypothetical protein